MSKKKVSFGGKADKQNSSNTETQIEQFVNSGHASNGGTKRLTLDIPADLHAQIKAQCALRGSKMVEEITALLEDNFAPTA